MTPLRQLWGEAGAETVVPRAGPGLWLTVLSAFAMGFLAVAALALVLGSSRLAARWTDELAQAATVRIAAEAEAGEAQAAAALEVLRTTPGIAGARIMTEAEQRALLEPWLGPDLPFEILPVPTLIEVTEARGGPDREGLRLRLAAEAPDALYDDHRGWRRPIVEAAGRVRLIGWGALLLVLAALAAIVTLAAEAALATNRRLIETLRLIGAEDGWIARAFIRRVTLRAAAGAGGGAAFGGAAVAALPGAEAAGGFLVGLGFQGGEWALLLLIPLVAGATALLATRRAARAALRQLG